MSAAARLGVLESFTGTFDRPALSPFYRLGLVASALVMLLLPVLYVAMIFGVVWLVAWHLDANVTMLEGSSSFYVLLLYLTPAVAGAVTILFMAKPLFARPPKSPEPMKLDPDEEPLLFAFVEKITDLTGAAKPAAIRVDCQVNASASFRRGLLSFLSDDLVLTIGLPLVAGFRTDQLAGVLAHEFGHFAQGAGMRLTYVVRSINAWFYRVVYVRDEWDVTLERTAAEADFRLAIVLQLARAAVWLSRKILWVLMQIGHATSSFLLRQMEFDADRYEARLAGSELFAKTSVELELLGLAQQYAGNQLNELWGEGRLVDDYSGLVAAQRRSFNQDAPDKILESIDNASTGVFDTHPATKDRIASAEKEAAPGVFHRDEPATELFSDFEALSKEAAERLYKHDYQLDYQASHLMAVSDAMGVEQEGVQRTLAAGQYFLALQRFHPSLAIAGPEGLEAEVARARSEEALAVLTSNVDVWTAVDQRLDAAEQRRLLLAEADGLTRAGFSISAESFDLPDSNIETLDQEIRAADQELAAAREEYEPIGAALAARLAADQERIFSLDQAAGRREEWQRLRQAHSVLASTAELIGGLRLQLNALAAVLNNGGDLLDKDEDVSTAAKNLVRAVQRDVKAVLEACGDTEYPFYSERSDPTIRAHLAGAGFDSSTYSGVGNGGYAIAGNAEKLAARILGRMAELVRETDEEVGASRAGS